VAAIERGVSMTLMRLHDVLAQFGLAPSVPTVGDQFDPYQHEVAERVEDSEHDEGTILEVVVPGYALHGRVLRPARVKVAARALAEGS
jgi:molecular chaperone GrpE